MKKKSWDYRDKGAPYSYWGKVQFSVTIKRGVRFVSTARHGGLMISKGVAEKELSARALSLAPRYGDYYCFEEDCLCDVAFWEHPEWLEALYEGKREVDKEALEKSVNYWYPEFF